MQATIVIALPVRYCSFGNPCGLAITPWPNSVGSRERLKIAYHSLPQYDALALACDPRRPYTRNLRKLFPRLLMHPVNTIVLLSSLHLLTALAPALPSVILDCAIVRRTKRRI